MKTKTMAMAAAVAALAAGAWAEPGGGRARQGEYGPHGGRDGGGRAPLERLLQNTELLQRLGVTETQQAALEDLSMKQRAKMIELRGAAELADLEVERLTDAATIDRAGITLAIQKAGQARTAIRAAQVDAMLSVREILGEDIYQKLRGEIRQRMQQRRQGGPDGEDDRPRGPRAGPDGNE